MSNLNHSRRKFCRLMLATGTCIAISPALAHVKSRQTSAYSDLQHKLVGLFHDKESARIIGMEYLKNTPEESHHKILIEEIFTNSDTRLKIQTESSPDRIKNVLVKKIREDYEHGRIIYLKDWIISITEARISALAAI